MPAPHSKTGIASFIIGLLNLTGLVAFLLYTNYYLNRSFTPESIIDAVFSSIGVGILFIIILITGFIFGIISLFQKNTKKLFGVLGLIVSAADIIIFAVLALAFTLMSPGM
ncbi:MAG TPA: hypothetical protein VG961_10760 [Ignavibacteria bacterium]|nr:hypothetical protein [Ignavibacteria bacterium]